VNSRFHSRQTRRPEGLLKTALAINIAAAALLLGAAGQAAAQSSASSPAAPPTLETGPNHESAVGDAPVDPGPPATDLSASLTHRNVRRAIRKVAVWQLQRAQPTFDQAIGQTYLELYQRFHDPAMLAPIRARMDAVMQLSTNPWPDDPTLAGHAKPLWWWCDALFMAPPVLADLAKITGERMYMDFTDEQWEITSQLLYDAKEHLFFRDASFMDKHEANGRGLFWSRGNGWVMAGLVRMLAQMPEDDPAREKYVLQLKQMAEEIASIQGADGLWGPGLLDRTSYPLPEVSGSAFFVYALAWGVDHGVLDRAKYLPVVEKGWAGLLTHVYADGRLGSIQPIGGAPGAYKASSSSVCGVGAFLLAGSEVDRLAR
jgi:unsaturated rhamnogalacturonyl hydrolase